MKMHRTLKKISSLLALLLVAIPLIFSIYTVAKLAIIKCQMSEALESEQLQTITVSESDIKWIIPGKELLIKGNLFDVESYKYTQNKLEIKGLYDKEEDNVQDHVAKMFHQKQEENTADNTALVSLFFQTLFIEKNTFSKSNLAVTIVRKINYSFTEKLVSSNSDILIPPPKTC